MNQPGPYTAVQVITRSSEDRPSRSSVPGTSRVSIRPGSGPRPAAFTLVELLVVVAFLCFAATMLLPAFARTNPNTQSAQCRNNLRQLARAWQMYTDDSSGALLTCEGGLSGRANWMTGVLDYSSNHGNWDISVDVVHSPLWPYLGKNPASLRCPADRSSVLFNQVRLPRVRSYSMSQVFGRGEWLDKTFNTSQTVWRTYAKVTDIVIPAHTYVFADEHPDSINDSAFANACTGAQPSDPPTAAQIIDMPASYHNGAGCFSFADGHAETHQWQGRRIQPPVIYNGALALNVGAGDSWIDVHWLAANTTVRR